MITKLLLFVASSALVASASTVTFQPNAQSINVGGTATVDVKLSGLTANQALGAFDLLVLNDSSIIKATSVTFFSELGDPSLELTGSTLTAGSVEAAETSFEDTSTLLGLQSGQPFSLFEVSYIGLAAGTSSLSLGVNPDYLANGAGTLMADPTVVNGSITVLGSTVTPTPEPSSIALLGSGGAALFAAIRRRRLA